MRKTSWKNAKAKNEEGRRPNLPLDQRIHGGGGGGGYTSSFEEKSLQVNFERSQSRDP